MLTHRRSHSPRARTISSAPLALILASFLGCGGSGFEAEVSGTVTLDGRPVGPGSVVFIPAGGSNPATGTIQPDGAYVMMSNRTPGLPAGAYQATVMVFDQAPAAPGERSTVQAKLVTPQKYADAATSGLQYDVTPGAQTIDIPLKSGP